MRVPLLLLFFLALAAAAPAAAQRTPPDDPRHAMLREALAGVLPARPAVPAAAARRGCLALSRVEPDALETPHGGSLLTARCTVADFRPLAPGWSVARYRHLSVFSAADPARGPAARDTVAEEESVLFEAAGAGRVRPVWRARHETGAYATWASVTPEVATAAGGGVLVGVQSCVSGTAGCSQELLRRRADGRWAPVYQPWPDQLPRGYSGRLWKGVRIDLRTLRGEGGLYGERDANCCPAERIRVALTLRGDSLVLRSHRVDPWPDR